MYKRGKDGNYNKVMTIDGTYVLHDEFTEALDAFDKRYDMRRYLIHHNKNRDLSHFVRSGTHFNCSVFLKEQPGIKPDDGLEGMLSPIVEHIDMKRAYTQFKECPAYAGFLGKITDFRKCSELGPIGMYRVGEFTGIPAWLAKIGCYDKKMQIYPSVELEWLKTLGATFTIVEGAWGSRLDFEFPQEFIENKYYAKWVGKTHHLNLETVFYVKKSSMDFVQNWASHANCQLLDFNDEVKVSYEKEAAFHSSHICAFITAYQRINLFEQVMKMDTSKIIRITTDDIYYEPHEFEMDAIFKHKASELPIGHQSHMFLSNEHDYEGFYTTSSGAERVHHMKEAFKGAGGSGKTHLNMTDPRLVNVLYVSPSYKLSSAMKHYGHDTNVMARLLTPKYGLSKYYNTIIIDEMSMITEEQKQQIFEEYGDCKLIFGGDPDGQLPPITGEQMTTDGFGNVREMTTNYRFTCQKHAELCVQVRELIKNGGKSNNFIFDNYEHIRREDIKYNPETDIILCSTNRFGNDWTAL